MHTNAAGLITVRGLLLPADWDERGNIIAAAISTYSEEEYLVEENPRGEELLAFIRQRVNVIGTVRVDDRGIKVIRVKRYEIIEE